MRIRGVDFVLTAAWAVHRRGHSCFTRQASPTPMRRSSAQKPCIGSSSNGAHAFRAPYRSRRAARSRAARLAEAVSSRPPAPAPLRHAGTPRRARPGMRAGLAGRGRTGNTCPSEWAPRPLAAGGVSLGSAPRVEVLSAAQRSSPPPDWHEGHVEVRNEAVRFQERHPVRRRRRCVVSLGPHSSGLPLPGRAFAAHRARRGSRK